MKSVWLGIVVLVITTVLGCTGIPKGLVPVSGFDANRYLGRWYEIARLDHSFERDLSNVSAEYIQLESDAIKLINRGYNEKTGKWKQIEGTARFIADQTIGSLKVSFFGPFYGGYHIIALDSTEYNYAMIAGPSRSYLWILSRATSLDEGTYKDLVDRAAELGFDTKKLINVKHDRMTGPHGLTEKSKMASDAITKLTPCPQSPNCVSSLAEDARHYIEPFRYEGDVAKARYEILSILNAMNGVRVTESDDNYIHAEFTSSIFRFIDDVEFYIDDANKLVQIRSASRTGYYDLGVNRRRIEYIRKKLDQKSKSAPHIGDSNSI